MTLTDHPALAARLIGFTETPYDLSDRRPSGLAYLRRMHCAPERGGSSNPADYQHQYLSLCHYEGRFVEAVIEVFARSRDPKARRSGKLRDQQLKGAAPLYTNLARDWETIEGMVSTTYALADDRA